MKNQSSKLSWLSLIGAVALTAAGCKFGQNNEPETQTEAVSGAGYVLAFSGEAVSQEEFTQLAAIDTDLNLRPQSQQTAVKEQLKTEAQKQGFYVGQFSLCPETQKECGKNPFRNKKDGRPTKLIPVNFETLKSHSQVYANLKTWPGYLLGTTYFMVGALPGIPALAIDFWAGLFKGNLFNFNELKALKFVWLNPGSYLANLGTADSEVVKFQEAIFDVTGLKNAKVRDAREVAKALAGYLQVDYTHPENAGGPR